MKITPLERWIARHLDVDGPGLSRERIETWQLDKLKETVSWAGERSAFYRDHLRGLGEKDLSSLDDFARFPFTTAQNIRSQPFRFLCVSQSEVSRVVTLRTSGTTGEPKRVFFTAEDQERTIDFFHHGMSTLVGPGDRVLILMPGELPGSVGDLLMRGLERLGAIGVPHGPVRDVWQTLDVMDQGEINSLVGIPTQVLELARRSNGKCASRSVLLSADHVPEAVSRELRRIWGCEVYTHYGMTEMGFGGGVECDARSGYHLREADLYFEIVDPETGNPVLEGESGEVVFTTLTRLGMPLIRYRTGDISRLIPTPCSCGTVLKTLARVKIRLDALCRLRSGGLLSMADLDEAIFSVEGVLDFRASLTSPAGVDHLALTVWVHETGRAEAAEAITQALYANPMVGAHVRDGLLNVEVTVSAERESITWRAAKRTIVDLR